MGTTLRAIMLTTAAVLLAASPLVGDVTGNDPSRGLGPARTTPNGDREGAAHAHLSAREAVREGNRLLDEGDAAGALEAYRQAEELRPGTREVPFVQGLAHFTLGEYEQARQAFEKAAAAMDDQLAFDAEYGIGTTYHAEALANLDNPQLAVSHFENAMQRYQNVLSSRRDHEAAREANLKAGTMWRQLKQLLEEQEQQQNQEQDENEEESQDQQSPQQDENEQQANDEQQSPQDQQEQDEQGENEKEGQAQDGQEQEEQQQQEAQQREQQALREQAQRRLREMMQALRQRKKERRETEVQTVPVAPVDKDW